MGLILGFLAAVALVLVFLVGLGVGAKGNVTKTLRERGLTRNTAAIYGDAMKLLNGMVRITELDGDFSADVLSETTKKQINDLLDRHRKEINK